MTGEHQHGLSPFQQSLLDDEPHIELSYLEDDVIHASGAVRIGSSIERIWNILTDYNNLSNTIPKVVRSELLEERGNIKIIDQTGRSGILFIEKSVRIKLNVTEHYPRQLLFSIIEGDFSVYSGSWTFEEGRTPEESFVSWQADVKPAFFAPPFLVSFVQHQDLPVVLRTIKETAERGPYIRQTETSTI
ncbi:SRPBCC family protein [Prosthecochloris sp. N3]|uniref:SRPBCC family protein n=1 Tax=Prosthecochloris ethylica TaxID=2743976 RepID=A0ABR9XTR9_9CHLB|nr:MULTISPECIES: SRPBCC family protein [Prosthecochloris]MEC9487477.1 SRPBCC family protein [Prosthecochloris sp.]MBF0587020.1 SRPBCC family protein [Prosthecochloris ethylica]MBF0637384.1 SRPBCC family protein [Prosthecochloris ethylica]NUK48140.1 SRPBCC family protein [Prosthecochloris ethylica]RNA65286.1 cyclase [Prosthecochloris sp. ZM_2]